MKGRTYRYIGHAPLYPFGYGLTYADVSVKKVQLQDESCVLADVCNEGSRDTCDVIQVYAEYCESRDAPPNPRLCGFARVHVKAGETVQVCIPLDPLTFTVVNDAGVRIPVRGKVRLYAGTGQPDARTRQLTGHECAYVETER